MESIWDDFDGPYVVLMGCTGAEIAGILGGQGREMLDRAMVAAADKRSRELSAAPLSKDEEQRQSGTSGRASTMLADPALGAGSDISTSTPDKNKKYLGAWYF